MNQSKPGDVGSTNPDGGTNLKPKAAALPTTAAHARDFRPGFVVKLIIMAVINAMGIYAIWQAWLVESYVVLGALAVLLIGANYVYFSKRPLALKYIAPGLAFLIVFQIFTIGYTGYVAFTNYGQGHNSTKADAIDALMVQNERRIEGSAAYPLVVVRDGSDLGFAIIDEGTVRVGTAEEPLQDAPDAVVSNDRIEEVPGYEVLPISELGSIQREVTDLRVPISDDAEAGSIRTQTASTGYVYRSALMYDEDADTMTDAETGVVYRPNDRGQFEAEDGTTLAVGWRVVIGFDNFTAAVTDSRYSEPFVKVLIWTVVFAVASVVLTFFVGLFLAVTLNDDRLRARKVLRALLILPYAFPAFMAFLLWRGMLNTDFGFFNQVLLGGASVPWLTDPNMARMSVLLVQVWVGFPYMFLICTGALQSIPSDTVEAARIDGAGAVRIWRSITLPLLLIAVTPLLIASFSFNFNNFNIIEMLTGGGPRFADASVPVGATDILITMVYRLSGLSGQTATNFGLASALSIVIFLIVATVSVIAFRRTQALEDIN